LGLPLRIQAHDLAINGAVAALQVTRQSFAKTGKTLEGVSVSRNQPHTFAVRIEQRAKAIPLDLKISKSHSGWLNGSALRLSGMGWKDRITADDN
jgi:hypothetical protein